MPGVSAAPAICHAASGRARYGFSATGVPKFSPPHKSWRAFQEEWKSSDILKGWMPGEGQRKIHLVQGINRILLRLENGWMKCGFSIIVDLGK